MNGTDVFVPLSYTTGPGSFLSHFGPEDQLFRRPSLNTYGQSYAPNPRPPPPPQQRDISFDQPYARLSPPPQRTSYNPPHLSTNQQQPPPNMDLFNKHQRDTSQQQYEEQIPRHMYPPNNQQTFFTDPNDDQLEQNPPMSTQRSIDQQDEHSHRQGTYSKNTFSLK
jgi:hypothetical protein